MSRASPDDPGDLAPRAPEPTLRHRLAGAGDTVFFGCQSLLYAFTGALLLTGVVAGVLGPRLPGGVIRLFTLAAFLIFTALRLRSTVLAYVEVGADGIVVRRRFIPYSAIVRVSRELVLPGGEHVVLHLEGGEQATFRVDAIDGSAREALAYRLEREVRAYRRAARQRALAVLDRRTQSLSDWRRALSQLSTGSDGYRSASVAIADVQETLDNAAASVERRIGAAIALAAGGGPDAPARIRIAAEGSADPRLRIALASIAAGETDDEAVEEALRAARESAA